MKYQLEKLACPLRGGLFLFSESALGSVSKAPRGTHTLAADPSLTSPVSPVHNLAYRLALLAGIGGLVLLTIAGSGDDIRTPLGMVLLVAAGLLVVLGKALDLLGYVEEGAADTEERR